MIPSLSHETVFPYASRGSVLTRGNIGVHRACDGAIVMAGGLLAACFFLPQVAPSHRPVAQIFLLQVQMHCEYGSLPMDAAAFALFGMVAPYAIGFLLAGAAIGRLVAHRNLCLACEVVVRGLLLLLGIGFIWALPCLVWEERTDPTQAGLCVSSMILSALVLWGLRRVGARRVIVARAAGMFLSLACLVWFAFLIVATGVQQGVYVSAGASLLLLVSHAIQVWLAEARIRAASI